MAKSKETLWFVVNLQDGPNAVVKLEVSEEEHGGLDEAGIRQLACEAALPVMGIKAIESSRVIRAFTEKEHGKIGEGKNAVSLAKHGVGLIAGTY